MPRARIHRALPIDPGGDWALLPDDPFPVVFERFVDYKFAHRGLRGGAAGGLPVAVMGPWLPKNFINPNADIADRANPFDSATIFPVTGSPGAGALPYRPIPVRAPGGRAEPRRARRRRLPSAPANAARTRSNPVDMDACRV